MIFIRLMALGTALMLAFMVLAWMLSGERKWLHRAWLVFRVALVAIVVALLMFAGEALIGP